MGLIFSMNGFLLFLYFLNPPLSSSRVSLPFCTALSTDSILILRKSLHSIAPAHTNTGFLLFLVRTCTDSVQALPHSCFQPSIQSFVKESQY